MKQRMRSLLAAMLALVLVLGLCPARAGALSAELAAAMPITVGEPVSYSLAWGYSAYFKVTTTKAGQFIVPQLTAASGAKPGYWVYDSTGSELSRYSGVYLTEGVGDYYIRLENYSDSSCTGTLTVTLLDNDSNEPNSTMETATVLNSGDTADFTVGCSDNDYFKVVTTRPGQDIAVTLSGFNYADRESFKLDYYPSAGSDSVEGSNWWWTISDNGTLLYHAAEAGEHYIRLWRDHDALVSRTISVELLDGDRHEPNDTRDTATALPIGTDETFSMGGYGDEDWFRFEVALDPGKDQKLCTLRFLDLNSDYSDQFYYDLYDPSGAALSTGTEVNIRHARVFSCSQTGVYYLRVYCKDRSAPRATLRVRVDEGGADPYESNDTWLTAAAVQTGQPISFQLSNTTDADWFRFEVPEADMTMALTLNSGKETSYQLWDAGTLAEYGAENADRSLTRWYDSYLNTTNETFRYKFTQPGTYYLKLTSDSSNVSEDLRTVTIGLEAATAEENNDTRYTATPLYDGVPQRFELSAYNDVDWFKIEVPAGTAALRVSATGSSSSHVYIYREADFEAAGNNASAIANMYTSDSTWTLTAPEAGTYYVKAYSDYRTGCTIRYDLLAEVPAGTTIAAAAPLTSGEWAEGQGNGSSYYYYSLGQLAAGTELRCYGENIGDFYLCDSEGGTVDSYHGGYDSCTLSVPADGVYYLKVEMRYTSRPYRVHCDIAARTLAEGESLTIETAADEVTLLVGETWKPEARLAPYTALTGRTGTLIDYTINNSSVADYSNYYGEITAKAVGTATVKFYLRSDSSVSKTVTVNVVEPTAAESISISGAPESLPLGSAAQLTAALNEGALEPITWSSSDSGILYVSSTGKVTAVGQGTASIIAATDSGVSASVTIAVTAAAPVKKVTGVSLDQYDLTLYMGEEAAQLTATVTPADADNAAVAWSTTSVGVAQVDQTGRITAVAPGVCVITASAGSYRASCVVTVLAERKRVESIRFDQPELELRMNASSPMTVLFTPDDATVKTLTWVSSDPGVASVSRTGVVTGLAVGETVITATTLDGGHTASIIVRVTAEGLRGDINGDGYADAADAMLCLQCAVGIGLEKLTDAQRAAADVNNDGFIDAGDAIKLLRYDARLLDTLD